MTERSQRRQRFFALPPPPDFRLSAPPPDPLDAARPDPALAELRPILDRSDRDAAAGRLGDVAAGLAAAVLLIGLSPYGLFPAPRSSGRFVISVVAVHPSLYVAMS